MAKSFDTLRARMSPDARARAETKAQTMLAEMRIPTMERKTDLCARPPRGRIAACGDEFETIARFPEDDAQIDESAPPRTSDDVCSF